MAGRAGRCDIPGRVIVQTYTPYHTAIQTALQQDFPAFCEQELKVRAELNLPPAVHMVLVRLRGEQEVVVEQEAQRIADLLAPKTPAGTRLSAPAPSPISARVANSPDRNSS